MKEHIWYASHRPDLLLIDPCGSNKILEDAVWASIKHMHPEEPAEATNWKHPHANILLTAFGSVTKQKPRVVKCVCGQSPCLLSAVKDLGQEVPPQCVPTDWSTNFIEVEEYNPGQQRLGLALGLYLDCTGKADKELPIPEGEKSPLEEEVRAAAEKMFTDYLKGRVCFQCNIPSTQIKKCSRCLQARYCGPECFKLGWKTHKHECKPVNGDGAAAAADKPAGEAAAAAAPEKPTAEPAAPAAAAADKQ